MRSRMRVSGIRSSTLACCRGVSSSSKTTTLASVPLASSATSSALPAPMKVRGFGLSSRLGGRGDDFGARRVREPRELGERLLERPLARSAVDADEHGAVAQLEMLFACMRILSVPHVMSIPCDRSSDTPAACRRVAHELYGIACRDPALTTFDAYSVASMRRTASSRRSSGVVSEMRM